MTDNRTLRAARLGYIVISLLIAALGAAFIACPDLPVSNLCRIGGILLILFGGFKILGYFSRDLYRLAFQYDLAFGLLMCALGVMLLVKTRASGFPVSVFFGIFILADSLLKLQISIDGKKFGLPGWWCILLAAGITACVSLLLLFRTAEKSPELMMTLGAALMCEGFLNLTTVLSAVQILHRKTR